MLGEQHPHSALPDQVSFDWVIRCAGAKNFPARVVIAVSTRRSVPRSVLAHFGNLQHRDLVSRECQSLASVKFFAFANCGTTLFPSSTSSRASRLCGGRRIVEGAWGSAKLRFMTKGALIVAG